MALMVLVQSMLPCNETHFAMGIKAGDIVVTSGTYLLNSEYNLRSGSNLKGDMKM